MRWNKECLAAVSPAKHLLRALVMAHVQKSDVLHLIKFKQYANLKSMLVVVSAGELTNLDHRRCIVIPVKYSDIIDVVCQEEKRTGEDTNQTRGE